MNNVEKTSNCILSLEDYHYDILNILNAFLKLFSELFANCS